MYWIRPSGVKGPKPSSSARNVDEERMTPVWVVSWFESVSWVFLQLFDTYGRATGFLKIRSHRRQCVALRCGIVRHAASFAAYRNRNATQRNSSGANEPWLTGITCGLVYDLCHFSPKVLSRNKWRRKKPEVEPAKPGSYRKRSLKRT